MTPNATPQYDSSDCPTGCCARFNPEGWDGALLQFHDKPFVRAETLSLAHVPLNMGRVMTRVLTAIDHAAAMDPGQRFVLSRDLLAFKGEHLFAVIKAVPGEEMVSLSGQFLTKVFEGPYSAVPHWEGDMQALARDQGKTPGAVWFFYTTCPKCQAVYGKNPEVGVVELLG